MGFVHHSNYLNYFELARIEWLDKIGFSYAAMEKKGIVMPVAATNITFISPAFFGDWLSIILSMNEMPKARIKLTYKVINQACIEIANGSTTLAFLDQEHQRPVRCPKALLDIFQSL
tara:strand:- start:345 stop:695 length:351 start_codon:yes stop_codon:yes gene_type:complete